MIDPAGVTPHTAPSTHTEAGVASREVHRGIVPLATGDAVPDAHRGKDNRFRYSLERRWNADLPQVALAAGASTSHVIPATTSGSRTISTCSTMQMTTRSSTPVYGRDDPIIPS